LHSGRSPKGEVDFNAIFSWFVNRLEPAFLDIVDAYWSKFFGGSPDTLRKETAQVLAPAELTNYAGCYLMEFGAAPVISLPPDEVESYREPVARWRPGVVRMPSVVEAVFGKRVATIVGPALIGYCDPNQFRPVTCDEARPLVAGDEEPVETLRAACEVRALIRAFADAAMPRQLSVRLPELFLNAG
jgi:hypothetical protein